MRKKVLIFLGIFIFIGLVVGVAVGVTYSRNQKQYVETFTPQVLEKDQVMDKLYRQEEAVSQKPVLEEPKQEDKKYDGVVYLTFDDGPVSKITPQILETLKKYDIKATFFMIGSYAKSNPELVKRVYDEGHTVASHSYTHKKSMFNSLAAFKDEVDKSVEVLDEITGEKTKYIRIPYGTKIPQTYKDYLTEKGLKSILWNCESYDSRTKTKTPEQILEGVKSTRPKKGDVIVIMHDTYGKQKTADALPSVIEYFQGLNYEFKKFE